MKNPVWYDSELIIVLILFAGIFYFLWTLGLWFKSWQPFIARHRFRLGWILVLLMAFFPVLGLVAQFFDRLPLAAAAFELAPRWLISKDAVERIRYEASAQAMLRDDCREVTVGRLLFRLQPDDQIEPWLDEAKLAVDRLAHLLPGSPPLPEIEMRELFDTYGRFDNFFTLAIDFEGDEPLRTVVHELTHLYLLWALIPGLPVDCPRWLNEGLAEHVSGAAMGDAMEWERYAMVRERDLVDLHVVSPAFSWPGRSVEWHAREATAMLLELHGEKAFLSMINGLRRARPFHSVYPIVTGRSLEQFEAEWKERFGRERVLENLPPQEIAVRLEWLAGKRGLLELQPLLNGLPERYLAKDKHKELISRAREHGARQCLARGDLREALGWLRGVDPDLPGNAGVRELIKKARESMLAVEPLTDGTRRKRDLERTLWQPEWPGRVFAWVIAFACSLMLVATYSCLRAPVVTKLRICWQSPGAGVAFRWLVVGLTGLAGSWFLRFLIISMIPYSGLAALPDLYRIFLAETLVVILWLALAWQLQRWGSWRGAASGVGDSTTDTLPPARVPVSVFAAFLVAGVLPPLLAAGQNGWQRMGFPLSQTLLTLLLFFAGSAAFALVVRVADTSWNRTLGRHLGPALIYALFRGGLAADPWGSLFALVAGWRLSELTQCSRRIWPAIFGDLLLCVPALLLCAGWFPAFDPVAGYWYGGSGAVPWWGVSALILLLVRDVGSARSRPH